MRGAINALALGHHRRGAEVPVADLAEAAGTLLEDGYRLALAAAHDEDGTARVVYVFTKGPPDDRVELTVRVDGPEPLPSLGGLSFAAGRFEREMADLFGITLAGHPQPRRLVLHQHWPEGWHPMRRDAGPAPAMVEDSSSSYPFAPVDGPGVYEIPVGPVHAGLIEPGHFRFWVVGETILRMKARLWFVHKGIERHFQERTPEAGLELAERISGDSAVGHGLAYCLAVEDALGIRVGADACLVRAALLELERLYNHVADLGALCNDVGFGLAQARALALREDLLRLNAEVTGHRLLRGGVCVGGASVARLPRRAELEGIRRRFDAIVELALSNSVVLERFTGTATLKADDARALGVVGPVARASGLGFDARVAHPITDRIVFPVAVRHTGDVLARFEIRVEEFRNSLDALTSLSEVIPDTDAGSTLITGAGPGAGESESSALRTGLGIVEGWRGAVVHRIELDGAGRLSRVKVVDPSFLNWPALPVALADTIVPDFPLANKSFNLSYAGNDL